MGGLVPHPARSTIRVVFSTLPGRGGKGNSAPADGRVKAFRFAVGDTVNDGDELVDFET